MNLRASSSQVDPQWWEHYLLSEVYVSSAPGCRTQGGTWKGRRGEGVRGGGGREGEREGRAQVCIQTSGKGPVVRATWKTASDLQPPPDWETHRLEF